MREACGTLRRSPERDLCPELRVFAQSLQGHCFQAVQREGGGIFKTNLANLILFPGEDLALRPDFSAFV